MASATIRKHVIYSGHVQGVGFRYTAQSIAADYAVSGYVKNLPDRRVELVVEGAPATVRAFLDAVAQAMGGYIHSSTVDDQPASGEFAEFRIRH